MIKVCKLLLSAIVMLVLSNSGCRTDEPPIPLGPTYEVPTVYGFTNVSYSRPSMLLTKLERLLVEADKGNTKGATVSSTKLKNMINNNGAAFGDPALDGSSYILRDHTDPLEMSYILDICDSIDVASRAMFDGAPGKAGVIVSLANPSEKYLFNARGLEYREVLEKSFVASMLYYQVMEVSFSKDKTGDAVDNTTVTPGIGTPLQHNWDEMFGYFGVPGDYPLNKTGLKFLGRYGDDSELLNGNCTRNTMNAFIKGRAAINNKDMKSKNDTKAIIRTELERILIATALHHLNRAILGYSDHAVRNHALSATLGLIKALKYNQEKKISDGQYFQFLNLLGSDFYKTPVANLYQLKSNLSGIYGYDSVKDEL